MSTDLANAAVPADCVIEAIRGWRTGKLVKIRKTEFTSSGRVYLADRRQGTIGQTEARFFPKTPQLRIMAVELAEIACPKKERWNPVDSINAREAVLDAKSKAEWDAMSPEEQEAINRENRIGNRRLEFKLQTQRRYPKWNAMQVGAEVERLLAVWEAENP